MWLEKTSFSRFYISVNGAIRFINLLCLSEVDPVGIFLKTVMYILINWNIITQFNGSVHYIFKLISLPFKIVKNLIYCESYEK